ncbi:hypothetical protein MN116_008637 [Schistosoma mekongi]|uniref:Uncharacterized protein n=1 Tax=Schistosoma mekongi TaxID=38744 RepID=A0AAE1Z4Z0_SCHME|nr:hypothetical protein MN116_008637 [Schistosoma mekongi]
MQIIYQYSSSESMFKSQSSYKWILLKLFQLIYASTCYSSWNSMTILHDSTISLQSLLYQRSKSLHKLLFRINYRENMKYHNLHGDIFENKSKQSSKMDKFFILSGGPHHKDRFLGFMKQLKMFFTEFGAQKYYSDERNFKQCENELNLQNITLESQEFNSTNRSNQTVDLNIIEQINNNTKEQINNQSIIDTIHYRLFHENQLNLYQSDECKQNCTEFNLKKLVKNIALTATDDLINSHLSCKELQRDHFV